MIKRKFFGGFFRNSPKRIVKPTTSMPVNAGKRFSGGMTSARNMPTQTYATKGAAKKASIKTPINKKGYQLPKNNLNISNRNRFRNSPIQRMIKRKSSATMNSFLNLVNFSIFN